MAELTPIPAEQRAAYYDALLAGRDEAARLGYPLPDDRIFSEFWAAIRSAYTPLIEAAARADERAKVAEDIAVAIATNPNVEHSCCDCGDSQDIYAAIARTYAVRMPGAAQEGAEPPDAYPSEGGADSGAQKPAQEAVG